MKCESCKNLMFNQPNNRNRTFANHFNQLATYLRMISLASWSDASEIKCEHCGKKDTESKEVMRFCSKCKCTFYCSVDCSKLNWETHRPKCKPNKRSGRYKYMNFDVLLDIEKVNKYIKKLNDGFYKISRKDFEYTKELQLAFKQFRNRWKTKCENCGSVKNLKLSDCCGKVYYCSRKCRRKRRKKHGMVCVQK